MMETPRSAPESHPVRVEQWNEELEMAKLYRSDANSGVTPVLTQDAYEAAMERWAYYDLYHTYEGVDPELMQRVRTGTLTFVSVGQYAGERAKTVYSGSYELLDRLAALHEIVRIGGVFVPFSNGPMIWDEELEDGYGPQTEQIAALLDNRMPAAVAA
jgi:hypothetical protein